MGMFVEVVKVGLGLGASIGAGTIVGGIAKNAVPSSASKFTKVCVWLGTAAIGGIVGKAVTEYINDSVDETAETVEEYIELIKDMNRKDDSKKDDISFPDWDYPDEEKEED